MEFGIVGGIRIHVPFESSRIGIQTNFLVLGLRQFPFGQFRKRNFCLPCLVQRIGIQTHFFETRKRLRNDGLQRIFVRQLQNDGGGFGA